MERSRDAPAKRVATLPDDIETALKAHPKARAFFEQLAPSYRRACVAWIDSAKRQETKERRLREAIERLPTGKKLGLK